MTLPMKRVTSQPYLQHSMRQKTCMTFQNSIQKNSTWACAVCMFQLPSIHSESKCERYGSDYRREGDSSCRNEHDVSRRYTSDVCFTSKQSHYNDTDPPAYARNEWSVDGRLGASERSGECQTCQGLLDNEPYCPDTSVTLNSPNLFPMFCLQ